MRSILSRFGRRVTILTSIGVLATAGSALAFFTAQASGGSGTSSQSVGSADPVNIGLSGSTAGALLPGGQQFVKITLTNGSNGAVHFKQTIRETSIVPAAQGCLAADFHMSDLPVDVTIPKSQSVDVTGSGTAGVVSMDDTAISQDACQGTSLTLNLVAP